MHPTGYLFNLRTRSLNNLIFNFVMIPASLGFAFIMDTSKITSRRQRGLVSITIVGVVTLSLLCGTLGYLYTHGIDRNLPSPDLDWTDSAAHPVLFLYVLFGITDACFQIVVQWTLSSMTNDPVLCARYFGAFKGTVSLGMCIAFTMDSQNVSYKAQVITQIVLYSLGLISLYTVLVKYIKETNYFSEENVIVPVSVEEEVALSGAVPQEVIEHEHEKAELANDGKTWTQVDSQPVV